VRLPVELTVKEQTKKLDRWNKWKGTILKEEGGMRM
jgi:hypothetical protein